MADAPLTVYAAGSLSAAFARIARAFQSEFGVAVAVTFGPSGLLRRRIEGGERASLFASADMGHPRALTAEGARGPAVRFARNRLAALVRPSLAAEPGALLDAMLDPGVRLGTSTPGSDPSGDYAWAVFAKAESLRPGARAALEAKALLLTGGADPAAAPAGRNVYAWAVESGRADIFLTYRTNALRARDQAPALEIVDLPAPIAVGADYGLVVLDETRADAWRLALHILSPAGQKILAEHGFDGAG